MAGRIEARLSGLGITLPGPAAPQANHVPFVRTGNQVFIAGQRAARVCALNLIAHAKTACEGDLDRVVRWVKLGGFVQGAPDFTDAPQVVNGASDLTVEVFGGAGKHARFAVARLPLDSAAEVDAVVEIR